MGVISALYLLSVTSAPLCLRRGGGGAQDVNARHLLLLMIWYIPPSDFYDLIHQLVFFIDSLGSPPGDGDESAGRINASLVNAALRSERVFFSLPSEKISNLRRLTRLSRAAFFLFFPRSTAASPRSSAAAPP